MWNEGWWLKSRQRQRGGVKWSESQLADRLEMRHWGKKKERGVKDDSKTCIASRRRMPLSDLGKAVGRAGLDVEGKGKSGVYCWIL